MSVERLSMKDFEIKSGCGFLEQHSVKETHPLHTHDSYEFFLIKKGRAIHIVNNDNQHLTKGSFVFIRPDDVHRYDFFKSFDFQVITTGVPVAEIETAFKWLEADLEELLKPQLPPHIMLDGYTYTDIQLKLEFIANKKNCEERRLYFLSILPMLLYQFVAHDETKVSSASVPNWIVELLEQMEKEENFTLGLPRMLSLANYSQEHLTREFRRYLNITPTEFINSKRMEYAAELLKSGEYTINGVCYKCGFNNLSHFYHLFKKQYYCSPKSFAANEA